MSTAKNRVCYFYDNEIGNFYYGPGHPMKPHRIRMTHTLLLNYGIYKHMQVFRPQLAGVEDMTQFHADDYIAFLQKINPRNMVENLRELQQFNVGEDCPVFEGLYEYCQLSAGGSIGGAIRLNQSEADIAINWSGGLHHAKRCEASGFCYVNDIVLAILELLKKHRRVLYIDIDIHHGDGVEEAFFTTDRVMTVSFHKYGEYFPGTGDIKDVGTKEGKNYSVNFPLKDGIDDESFMMIFDAVMAKVMAQYQPDAIVLQCGADSLTGDRLGSFNLSLRGHGHCVEFMKKYGKPMLVLGGGGYTIRNVARCWCYETACCCNVELPDQLPFNDYYDYYGPDFQLHIAPSNMENLNHDKYLHAHLEEIFTNLSAVSVYAPSGNTGGVEGTGIPGDLMSLERDEDKDDKDSRRNQHDVDKRVAHQAEYYDRQEDELARGGRLLPHHSHKDDKDEDLLSEFRPKSDASPAPGAVAPASVEGGAAASAAEAKPKDAMDCE